MNSNEDERQGIKYIYLADIASGVIYGVGPKLVNKKRIYYLLQNRGYFSEKLGKTLIHCTERLQASLN